VWLSGNPCRGRVVFPQHEWIEDLEGLAIQTSSRIGIYARSLAAFQQCGAAVALVVLRTVMSAHSLADNDSLPSSQRPFRIEVWSCAEFFSPP
jgi:hypothetical protein